MKTYLNNFKLIIIYVYHEGIAFLCYTFYFLYLNYGRGFIMNEKTKDLVWAALLEIKENSKVLDIGTGTWILISYLLEKSPSKLVGCFSNIFSITG